MRANHGETPLRIVLTGPPGSGKTTAVTKIVAALNGKRRMAGFYTEEMREAGRRVGFRWHRLDGRTGTLAHVHVKSPLRVSKYGVDIESFEREAVAVLDPSADADLFVVDEIGKMECFSNKFVETIRRLLQSNKSILASGRPERLRPDSGGQGCSGRRVAASDACEP